MPDPTKELIAKAKAAGYEVSKDGTKLKKGKRVYSLNKDGSWELKNKASSTSAKNMASPYTTALYDIPLPQFKKGSKTTITASSLSASLDRQTKTKTKQDVSSKERATNKAAKNDTKRAANAQRIAEKKAKSDATKLANSKKSKKATISQSPNYESEAYKKAHAKKVAAETPTTSSSGSDLTNRFITPGSLEKKWGDKGIDGKPPRGTAKAAMTTGDGSSIFSKGAEGTVTAEGIVTNRREFIDSQNKKHVQSSVRNPIDYDKRYGSAGQGGGSKMEDTDLTLSEAIQLQGQMNQAKKTFIDNNPDQEVYTPSSGFKMKGWKSHDRK